ncbi:MAG TPA: hypothetical protein VLU43_11505 [Anaeromyxobacteraceae bacterium]|nr:hypothetical protein [Anaeromyxobacteraceae bacterium]
MKLLALAAVLSAAASARAAPPEEVEVTAGVVTGLSCAIEARERGELGRLNACPPIEATKELVVFDVAERRIYRISPKKVGRWQLESAFGGGSIDFTGRAVKTDPRTGIATVDVNEFSITRKPKAGAFKGCL